MSLESSNQYQIHLPIDEINCASPEVLEEMKIAARERLMNMLNQIDVGSDPGCVLKIINELDKRGVDVNELRLLFPRASERSTWKRAKQTVDLLVDDSNDFLATSNRRDVELAPRRISEAEKWKNDVSTLRAKLDASLCRPKAS